MSEKLTIEVVIVILDGIDVLRTCDCSGPDHVSGTVEANVLATEAQTFVRLRSREREVGSD